jgi:hypothetical protein
MQRKGQVSIPDVGKGGKDTHKLSNIKGDRSRH